jgi:glycosyltransferase involved in cell wall biosynthesis
VAGVSQNPEKTENESGRFYPKVSIVIPVYNGANYMRDAIDSALAQTYGNLEVIVVNDGSRDNGETDRIARSYGDRIRYFSKENGGVATALNLGIEKMTGEYFSWLSHDDMYKPDKVKHEVRALAKQKDRTVVIAEGYQVVNREGVYQCSVNLYLQYGKEQLQNGLFCLLRGGINGCAMLIHKSRFEQVGLFNPALPTTQDYDLWFRMLRGQPIVYLPSTNVLSRSHDEQGSKAMLDVHSHECDGLWNGILDALTEQEQSEISGNSIDFYFEMWEFLSTTGYHGAIAHAAQKVAEAVLARYQQTKDRESLQILWQVLDIDSETAVETILPVLLQPKKGKRLFFQMGDRDTVGGLNKIVVQTASALSAAYDVIIGSMSTSGTGGYPSTGVTELCSVSPIDREQKYAALLAVLHIDVYVLSFCCSAVWLPLLSIVKAAGIQTIAWHHEDYFFPYWQESLWRSLPEREEYLGKASAVVWLNSASLSMYGLHHQNGTCIPNQISVEADDAPYQARGKRLLAVGRFSDAVKGLDDLLQAFEQIQAHHPDAELDIVGSWDLNLPVKGKAGMTCEQFIQKSTIRKGSLHFVPWTDSIAEYYCKSALLLMPSLYEGFGLVVLEAAAHHVPAAAYDGSGMADIITDDVDGVQVHRGDWKELATRVSALLDQPERIQKMAGRLPEMLSRYQTEKILTEWQALFQALLSGDEAAGRAYFTSHRAPAPSPSMIADAIGMYEVSLSRISRLIAGYKKPEETIWEKECQRIQSSFSWRITKPLRSFKSAVGPLLRFCVQPLIAIKVKITR